jgi:hypothetical protein
MPEDYAEAILHHHHPEYGGAVDGPRWRRFRHTATPECAQHAEAAGSLQDATRRISGRVPLCQLCDLAGAFLRFAR